MMAYGEVFIRDGYWEGRILPDFGANLIGLSYGGKELLRTPACIGDLLKSPCLYGNPFLMPPNRTKDGRFHFEGRDYQLSLNEPERNNHIHGGFYDAPFEITRQEERQVHCLYRNRGERYPFPCAVKLVFRAAEKGVRVEVSIENTGTGAMPLVMGFHTTFQAPERFQVPVGRRWVRDERLLPTGRMEPPDDISRELAAGCGYGGKRLSGYYTAWGHEARIEDFYLRTSPGFTQWVLFGGGNEDYLCVEPMTGPVNALNMPGYYRVLKPGEKSEEWLEFTAAEGKCQ